MGAIAIFHLSILAVLVWLFQNILQVCMSTVNMVILYSMDVLAGDAGPKSPTPLQNLLHNKKLPLLLPLRLPEGGLMEGSASHRVAVTVIPGNKFSGKPEYFYHRRFG